MGVELGERTPLAKRAIVGGSHDGGSGTEEVVDRPLVGGDDDDDEDDDGRAVAGEVVEVEDEKGVEEEDGEAKTLPEAMPSRART